MSRKLLVLAAAASAFLAAAPASVSRQAPAPRPDAHVQFVDVTAKSKIGFVHKSGASPEKYMVETFGSGVAWIDYDNDGFPDLYFVNGAPGAANALYHNDHDGTFTDVTAKAGVAGNLGAGVYKTGVAVGDFDNDGYLDLYVTAFGPNALYKNNGDGTFTDVTATAGVAGGPKEWSTSTGFFDFDRDGRLDLYVVNYLDYRLDENPYCGQRSEGRRMYCHPTMFDGVADRLFHNNGNGTFTDVSRHAWIANPAGKGLGVTFCDFDRDGDTDVYVANDTVRNFLYRNNGDGTFLDVAYGAGVGFDPNGKPQAGMGTDCADVDGNGFPDLFVCSVGRSRLYRNQGDGTYATIAGSMLDARGWGTAAAFGDFDRDGRVDAVVSRIGERAELFRNTSPARNHWLAVQLHGRRSNRDGIGAMIHVATASGGEQWNRVTTATGYGSSSDRTVFFGTGRESVAKSIEILWPSGVRQNLENVKADRYLTIDEPLN